MLKILSEKSSIPIPISFFHLIYRKRMDACAVMRQKKSRFLITFYSVNCCLPVDCHRCTDCVIAVFAVRGRESIRPVPGSEKRCGTGRWPDEVSFWRGWKACASGQLYWEIQKLPVYLPPYFCTSALLPKVQWVSNVHHQMKQWVVETWTVLIFL